jgi:glycosyltransferase involved in cell wall biosynthesis
MLSILIPEHNYDCRKLVNDLVIQCQKAGITYEIIVLDDYSSLYLEENRQIKELPACTFIETHQNKGAAQTRNILAGMARYPYLLMMDCDAQVPDDKYLQRYLEVLDKADVIIGGIAYPREKPEPDKLLRWKYGRCRECIPARIRQKHPYQSFFSFQFVIRKDIMLAHPFEETLKDYGHEDTLLGFELGEHGVSVLYIDNPLIHLGLDSNPVFLQKSLQATRKFLSNPVFQQEKLTGQIKLFRTFKRCSRLRLTPVIRWFFVHYRNRMQQNLFSSHPSLFLYDLYRLGYLCLLDHLESNETESPSTERE